MSVRLAITHLFIVAALAAGAGCDQPSAPKSGAANSPTSTSPAASESETPVAAWKQTSKNLLADELDRVDPKKDGWDSEADHDAIKARYYKWVKFLGAPQPSAGEIGPFLDEGFSTGTLRPALETVSRTEAAFRVEKAKPGAPDENLPGVAGLLTALEKLRLPFRAGEKVDIHVKIFRVEPVAKSERAAAVKVSAYIDLAGHGANGERIQQNAVWRTQWNLGTSGDWRISSLQSISFDEVTLRQTRPLLEDCTEAVLAALPAWKDQLVFGLNHWRVRLESSFGSESAAHAGAAVGDANGDGLDDLFYGDIGGLPKRLFLQNADGTLRDAAKDSGLDLLDRIRSALFLDLDNDGDQDLALGREDQVLVFENDGAAHFSLRTRSPVSPQVMSLAASDFDLDGDLDLYVCSYGSDATSFGDGQTPSPWHDANNGTPNSLLRNDGGWKFTDATAATGLDQNNSRFTFAAVWEDYDNDGDSDLFVVNDFGRKNLYQNQLAQSGAARFLDVAASAHAEDIGPGMGVTFGDANGDGLLDIHVSNMFSGAGNRITFLPQYKPTASEETLADHRRFARGNSLLINKGDGTFSDVSEKAGITLGRWAWGSLWTDVNNDGWEDILVDNGYITGVGTEDL